VYYLLTHHRCSSDGGWSSCREAQLAERCFGEEGKSHTLCFDERVVSCGLGYTKIRLLHSQVAHLALNAMIFSMQSGVSKAQGSAQVATYREARCRHPGVHQVTQTVPHSWLFQCLSGE